MAKNVKKIAKALGAKIGTTVPDAGGGTFGMARLAQVLAVRLKPSQGKRPGRPSDPSWTHTPKVPMSDQTIKQLDALAEEASTPQRKISPMQVAAQLLEDSLHRVVSD